MIDSAELLKKLQVKSGMRLWLINVPRPFAEALSAGAEVELVHAGDACDGVIAFCENPAEVASFVAQVLPALPPDGLLWFGYRKGDAGRKAGLTRDIGWDAVLAEKFETVRSISFDDVWTGLRFRSSELVKPRR